MKLSKNKEKKGLIIFMMIAMLCITSAQAQLSPFGAMYYQNQYLINPAMAGAAAGLRMDLGYSSQQTSMPGAPQTQLFTLGYRVNKVGLGVNLLLDQAGLINRTRLMGTYAYHLPLSNGDDFLRFGLSMGLMKERISSSEVNGDAGDPILARFNERPAYLDGDFGLSFEKKALSMQLALPNLKTFFRSDAPNASNIVNQARLFSAISYRFDFPATVGGMGIEPKISYRSFSNYQDIVDLGTNISIMDDKMSLMAMYHSSKSVSLGLGSQLSDLFYLNAVYQTQTAALNGNANGNFELNLRVNFGKDSNTPSK